MWSVDHCHMDHKAPHEEECDVEVERSLCDFSPRKPYCLDIVWNFQLRTYLKKMRGMGNEEGAESLKMRWCSSPVCVQRLCYDCIG